MTTDHRVEYEPLWPLESMPLHGARLPVPMWWACAHPERPWERDVTIVDDRCRACMIGYESAHLRGEITQGKNWDPSLTYYVNQDPQRLIDRARYWGVLP